MVLFNSQIEMKLELVEYLRKTYAQRYLQF